MSKRYTGVGALKTDFTRTGKRSAKGAVADGGFLSFNIDNNNYHLIDDNDEWRVNIRLLLNSEKRITNISKYILR